MHIGKLSRVVWWRTRFFGKPETSFNKTKEGTKPQAQQYYSIPKAYYKQGRNELNQMVDIEVLIWLPWDDYSQWETLSFMVPKKTGYLCVIMDFQKMNTCIEQHPFPLPRIVNT